MSTTSGRSRRRARPPRGRRPPRRRSKPSPRGSRGSRPARAAGRRRAGPGGSRRRPLQGQPRADDEAAVRAGGRLRSRRRSSDTRSRIPASPCPPPSPSPSPSPVVDDLELDLVLAVGDEHARRRRARVFERVRQRLLDDAIRGQIDAGRGLARLAGDRRARRGAPRAKTCATSPSSCARPGCAVRSAAPPARPAASRARRRISPSA